MKKKKSFLNYTTIKFNSNHGNLSIHATPTKKTAAQPPLTSFIYLLMNLKWVFYIFPIWNPPSWSNIHEN